MSARFWHLTHDLLTCLLRFELLNNNVLQAVGALWRWETSIPMVGLFRARVLTCTHGGCSQPKPDPRRFCFRHMAGGNFFV